MEIVTYDPIHADSSQWARMHAFRRARQAESTPDEPILADADFEAEVRAGNPGFSRKQWLAIETGCVVGSLILHHSTPESPHHAENRRFMSGGCGVLGPWRRRGIARRFLALLYRNMCDAEREIVTLSSDEPDGLAFLRHLGASPKLNLIDNRLALDGVDWARLARWKADAMAANPDLRLETHVGRVPFEVWEPMLPDWTALLNDVPRGELEGPPANVCMSDIREHYRRLDVYGGGHDLVMLRSPDGRIAGIADVQWDLRMPDRAYHSFTGVRPDLRGRGLALALKVAALELVRANRPSVTCMTTGNAASNAPMLAVNTKLGFVAHRHFATYQLDRERLGELVEARRAA